MRSTSVELLETCGSRPTSAAISTRPAAEIAIAATMSTITIADAAPTATRCLLFQSLLRV